MAKMFECKIQVGPLHNRSLHWVKGVRWAGDSIVVDLSSDQCYVSGELAGTISTLVEQAENLPVRHWMVSCADVTSPEDLEDHPDLVAKYKAFIREYINTYGRDALLDILNHSEAAPSEEVPGNE